ncbi:hypothetical protein L211DRAFT_850504 [Terfezia boudieri ATCC MYA-4762]|uniref:Uncharacterized protein n=1 Tax=Terfezia boudieri ATCC MYA-4762 TaxID=1051890 RepID=A0A3N4LHT0_9PEZI|nr:hypothetical protein L211DRAFT_850504 [Terfezia boudieri ATCC MYA-4762]
MPSPPFAMRGSPTWGSRSDIFVNETTLLLDNAKFELRKGKPEGMEEKTWLDGMGILRDELEYTITKVKYQHDSLHSQLIALHLDYISQIGAPTRGRGAKPANSFENRLLYAGTVVGKIAWIIDWRLWRLWAQVFEVRTGMWGDEIIPVEGNQEPQSTMFSQQGQWNLPMKLQV